MARGWEREPDGATGAGLAKAHHFSAAENSPDAETLQLIRKKESIELSKVRVEREIHTAKNPRYKAILEKALTDLDAQLKEITAQ